MRGVDWPIGLDDKSASKLALIMETPSVNLETRGISDLVLSVRLGRGGTIGVLLLRRRASNFVGVRMAPLELSSSAKGSSDDFLLRRDFPSSAMGLR